MKRLTIGSGALALAVALAALAFAKPAEAEPGVGTLGVQPVGSFGGSVGGVGAGGDVAMTYRPAFAYRLAEGARADAEPPPFFIVPLAEREDAIGRYAPPSILPSLESVLSRAMTPEYMSERRLALAPMVQGLSVLGLRIRGSL